MKHHFIVISELKAVAVLAFGSLINFFAAFDPAMVNGWVGLACGILALIVGLEKCIDALITLRKKVKVFIKAIREDFCKRNKK